MTPLAYVRKVSSAIEEVTNNSVNGQDKTMKRSEKTLKRKEMAPCLRCGTIGHWKNECKVILEHRALAGNAAIQEFASYSKEQQLIVLRLVRMEFSPSGV